MMQHEGAWNESGKGISVWDHWTHTPGNTENNQTADISIDFYHLYKSDIQLMKALDQKLGNVSGWSDRGDGAKGDKRGEQTTERRRGGERRGGIRGRFCLPGWTTHRLTICPKAVLVVAEADVGEIGQRYVCSLLKRDIGIQNVQRLRSTARKKQSVQSGSSLAYPWSK